MVQLKAYFSLLSFVGLVVHVLGQDCCVNGCSQNCPWLGSCDNGKDFDCMDKVAGVFKNQDRSLCNDIDECSEDHAARRAGSILGKFPYYNGGYPIEPFSWEGDTINYQCNQASDSGNYCDRWSGTEDSLTSLGFVSANCSRGSENGMYCTNWFSNQTEYKKCLTVFDNSLNAYQKVCCDKNNKDWYPCCKNTCDLSAYIASRGRRQYTQCQCLTASSDNLYCLSWSCEEYSNPSETFEDGRVFETFTCDNNDSSSMDYCVHWKGSFDSRKKFGVSKCECSETVFSSGGKAYCNQWSCDGKSALYFWPNFWWCWLSGLLGAAPQMILMYLLRNEDNILGTWLPWPCLFIWTGGFCMIGIWKSGLVHLFFIFLPTAVVTLIAWLPFRKWMASIYRGQSCNILRTREMPYKHFAPKIIEEELENNDKVHDGSALPHSSATDIPSLAALVVPPPPSDPVSPSSIEFIELGESSTTVIDELCRWKALLEADLITYELYKDHVEKLLRVSSPVDRSNESVSV